MNRQLGGEIGNVRIFRQELRQRVAEEDEQHRPRSTSLRRR